MAKIIKHDTNGVKGTLDKGEFGYDDYVAGGDAGRVYIGDGTTNTPLGTLVDIDDAVAAEATVRNDAVVAEATTRGDADVVLQNNIDASTQEVTGNALAFAIALG